MQWRWLFCAAVLAFVLPTSAATAAEAKTSKERLSDKASDEQRVDNCRVPPTRRGPVARPDCDPRRADEAESGTRSGERHPR